MSLSQLAVPSTYGLIIFLGYPSQWLLMHLEPGPLAKEELIKLNVTLVLIFITYTRTAFVNPGTIPKDWQQNEEQANSKGKDGDGVGGIAKNKKWCRRCDAPKPPRAHHCKTCKKCIPRMDHHCPWTANCVSHLTFPHFLRFLFYGTCGLAILESFLIPRISYLWRNRDMPSYLGPNGFQLAHLFVILFANSLTLFAVGILFIRNMWCLAVNTTTIEGWEIERHRTLVRRARHFGGYLESPDGNQVRIKKQEFPYDIGIWSNIVQGMSTANPLSWFNPFAATPWLQSGLSFPTNGFGDANATWPPPDPDRTYRRHTKAVNADAFTYNNSTLSPVEIVAAFKARQAEDEVRRRKPFVARAEAKLARQQQMDDWNDREHSREEHDDGDEHGGYEYGGDASDREIEARMRRCSAGQEEGEESWRNSEGERLRDFGVEEDVEFYDEQEDDVPLSELLAKRNAGQRSTSVCNYTYQ